MGTSADNAVPPDEAHRERWIEEERPHRQQAQLPADATMHPLQPGAPIADASVHTPDGESLRLHDIWNGQPALIVTGSLTCPPSRIFNPALSDLQERFGDRVHVCLLYVIDAHPAGSACPYTGTEWLAEDNEAEQLRVAQPASLEERTALTRRFIDMTGLRVPVYIDGMGNAAWNALGRSPNMAVLVGTDGRCRLYQDWFMPAALATQLDAELAR